MPPKLWEFRGYTALVPMSFFATGYAIFMIMSCMMPAFGVAHHHHNVMPLGKTVAQGYHFGPSNMMILIILFIVSNILWMYMMIGIDALPDARPELLRWFKIFYWGSIVACAFLFGIPGNKMKIGPFQYGPHEIAGNIYMVLTAFWLMIFAQFIETDLGRNAVGVGCMVSIIGVVGNLIESGVHNARHGGPFQFFGLAVLLGTMLMTLFGAELWKYVHFNANGFPADAPPVSSSAKAAAGAEETA